MLLTPALELQMPAYARVFFLALSFSLIGFMACTVDSGTNASSNSSVTTGSPSTAGNPANTPATSSPSSSTQSSDWRYDEREDKMRNQTTRWAELDSNNRLVFDFPYEGGSTGTLSLRVSPKYGKDVMLQVSKGQFLCSFEGCAVHVKFDSGPIESYGAAEAADGSSDVIFIHNYAGFLKKLRTAKKVMIEAQFYRAGWQQLEFSPAGLNW